VNCALYKYSDWHYKLCEGDLLLDLIPYIVHMLLSL